MTSRAFLRRRELDTVLGAEIGPRIVFMGEVVALRAGYDLVLEDGATHVVRSSSCVAIGFATCVDTRHIFGNWPTGNGLEALSTEYVGISVGFGYATGLELE